MDGIQPSPGRYTRLIIFWRCYAQASHYSNACGVDMNRQGRVIIANFETLTASQKGEVPWGPYLMLKGFLTPGIKDEPGPVENLFSRIVPRASEASNATNPSGSPSPSVSFQEK